MREFLATLVRPNLFPNPASIQTLTNIIRGFETRFRVAEDNQQVTERLLALIEQVPMGGRLVHDANIVATMQTYGINRLLTNNVSDFNRFSAFIMVLPLVS